MLHIYYHIIAKSDKRKIILKIIFISHLSSSVKVKKVKVIIKFEVQFAKVDIELPILSM